MERLKNFKYILIISLFSLFIECGLMNIKKNNSIEITNFNGNKSTIDKIENRKEIKSLQSIIIAEKNEKEENETNDDILLKRLKKRKLNENDCLDSELSEEQIKEINDQIIINKKHIEEYENNIHNYIIDLNKIQKEYEKLLKPFKEQPSISIFNKNIIKCKCGQKMFLKDKKKKNNFYEYIPTLKEYKDLGIEKNLCPECYYYEFSKKSILEILKLEEKNLKLKNKIKKSKINSIETDKINITDIILEHHLKNLIKFAKKLFINHNSKKIKLKNTLSTQEKITKKHIKCSFCPKIYDSINLDNYKISKNKDLHNSNETSEFWGYKKFKIAPFSKKEEIFSLRRPKCKRCLYLFYTDIYLNMIKSAIILDKSK